MNKNMRNISLSEMMQGDEGRLYTYATVNKHPLNALKMLGVIKKNDDIIYPWFRSSERIAYVSRKLPLLVSYNTVM